MAAKSHPLIDAAACGNILVRACVRTIRRGSRSMTSTVFVFVNFWYWKASATLYLHLFKQIFECLLEWQMQHWQRTPRTKTIWVTELYIQPCIFPVYSESNQEVLKNMSCVQFSSFLCAVTAYPSDVNIHTSRRKWRDTWMQALNQIISKTRLVSSYH